MKRTAHISGSYIRMRGFTLIELMITITIAAVLLGIAIPSMRTFILNNRLTAAANDLLHSYQVARTEAIKRQKDVIVCASADSTTCSGASFAAGWIVFEDTDNSGQRNGIEQIVEYHNALDTSLTVNTDNTSRTIYNASGILDTTQSYTRFITMCDSRGVTSDGGANSTARALIIAPGTGRTRATRTQADVALSVGCP